MRTLLLSISTGIVFLLMRSTAYGQVNVWPEQLALPPAVDSLCIPDTHSVYFTSQQNLYIQTLKNHDSLALMHSDSMYDIRQTAIYDIKNENGATSTSRTQYFDMSGSYLKKYAEKPLQLGFDWTPSMLLNMQNATQSILGSVDIGPLVRFQAYTIPFMLRGGASSLSWSDSLPLQLHNANVHTSFGGYAGFELGDFSKPLSFIPLYINARGYGRSNANAGLISGIGTALYSNTITTGDTVFALATDSLINGNNANLGQSLDGKSRYSNIDRRFEHSYQYMGGLKAKERFLLQPGIVYSFSQYSLKNYSPRNALSDKQNTNRMLHFVLNSSPEHAIVYNGGLQIDWEHEDWLYGQKQGSIADSLNIDSLRVNLNDYTGYKASTSHTLTINAGKNRTFSYTFDMTRYAKTYGNFYMQNNDTVRNNNDNDWIVQHHRVELVPVSSDVWKTMFTGEYSKNLRYNLRAEKSAYNYIDYLYRVGTAITFIPNPKLQFEENFIAEVNKTEYSFPVERIKLNVDNTPPAYSRKFSSRLTAIWNQSKYLSFKAEWGERYWDNGYWLDKIYLDTLVYSNDSLINTFSPYYAIQQKSWDHSLTLAITLKLKKYLILETGSPLEGIFYSEYKKSGYITTIGYTLTPYILLQSELNKTFNIQCKLKRYIYTRSDDYWDLNFCLTAGI